MAGDYRTIYAGGIGEIVEKKSKFLAAVMSVKSEEEAISFIENKKKEHRDAGHNCYAYIVGTEQSIIRCSDDGEPSGTAGKPILDVIQGEGLYNIVVVVTRYFGGTLLGTGGLVRAYSASAKIGLSKSTIITKTKGNKVKIQINYVNLAKVQYLLGKRKITTVDSLYKENIVLTVVVSQALLKELEEALIEGTNGQIQMTIEDSCYFAEIDGKIEVFD